MRADSRKRGIVGLTLLLAVLAAASARAGWLRPVIGGGNFYSVVDLVTFQGEDGRFDAVVLVSIDNRELSFEREAGRWEGRVAVDVRLTGAGGAAVTRETTVRLRAHSEAEVQSPTLSQVFTLSLRDIPFASGRADITLTDLNRYKPGLFNRIDKVHATSEAVADWAALPAPGEIPGLVVGDLVYLGQAPIREWGRDADPAGPGVGGPWDYINPQRRYGIEQPRVQVYFNLYPPLAPAAREQAAAGDLLVEILSKELDYVLRDTLRLSRPVREALAAGRTAAVYYEMDTELMPPGSFRLGVAPLDGTGLGYLGEFDVTWRLDQLARGRDELLGEGRTIFRDEQLHRFEAASRIEQEVMLDRFWRDLDPDPTTPYNEVYAEYRRRVSYVREQLGGFDEAGATDPRGEIYILLGAPDHVRASPLPMNESELEDARIQTYQRYAPDREGTWIKGSTPGSSEMLSPYQARGGIPMPYSPQAELEILQNKTSPRKDHGFELWTYDDARGALFPNAYSAQMGGLRFLFLDRDGAGHFELESSNTMWGGD